MVLLSLQKMFPFFCRAQGSGSYAKDNSSGNPLNYHELSLTYIFLLACSFLLAGIIFFFAFNWQSIPNVVKLVSIQALFCLGSVGAMRFGLQTILGKASLACASALVGVFFAVFGQVYQTGADSYTLFLTWAIAIVPFVLVSNFAILWIFLLVLINIAYFSTWKVFFLESGYNEQLFIVILSAYNGIILLLRELLKNKFLWLQSYSTRIFPYACTLGAVGAQIILSISENFFTSYTLSAIFGFFFLFYIYRYTCQDIFISAINIMTFCLLVLFYSIVNIEFDIIAYIAISLFAIVLFTLSGKYIESIYRKFYPQGKCRGDKKSYTVENSIDNFEKRNKAKPLLQMGLKGIMCGIGAIATASILSVSFYLIYSEYVKNSHFLSVVGALSLLFSVFLYRKNLCQQQIKSYFLAYQSLTSLLVGYITITISLSGIHNLTNTHLAFVFSVLAILLFPFIKNVLSRILMVNYAVFLLHLANISSIFIVACTIISLIIITYNKLYESSKKIIKDSVYVSLSVITMQEIFMLSNLSIEHITLYYQQYFTTVLTLWILVLLCLNIKNMKKYFSYISTRKVFNAMFVLISIAFFMYIQAHTILFCIGLLLLSIYLKNMLLLRFTIILSIPLISFYYYNLSITLLYKSYTLFLSGCLLLFFCACNKKVLTYEK